MLNNDKRCFVCGTTNDLHVHHIFEGAANRKKSEEDDMKIYLCGYHHNMSNAGIHYNKELELKVKKLAQQVWMKQFVPNLPLEDQIEAFIKRYGRNYLD